MSCVFIDWSTVTCLLILPMVFQVLINGHVVCPNCIWSCDMIDDQRCGWSCVVFPGSCATRSRDTLGTGGSRDKSCDGSCDRFPQSRVLEITWLELGLGVVMKWLVIVKWVLGSFGNVFLVGASFAHDTAAPYEPTLCGEPPFLSRHAPPHVYRATPRAPHPRAPCRAPCPYPLECPSLSVLIHGGLHQACNAEPHIMPLGWPRQSHVRHAPIRARASHALLARQPRRSHAYSVTWWVPYRVMAMMARPSR